MNARTNKNVLLVGGRSKAKSMAVSLLDKGYQVTAINDNYDDCLELAERPIDINMPSHLT